MRTDGFFAQRIDFTSAAVNQTQIDGHDRYRLRGKGARQFLMSRW
jgi:hypothetical protein